MKRRWCKLKWKWKVNRADAEQLASQQKYGQQIEIDIVGVAAHGDPQKKQGMQKRMRQKHEVSQTVVWCAHCTAPTDMNEKEAAGKLFSECTNDERVNNSWRVPMKKKINLIFILTLLFISIGTIVRAAYCSSCGQSAGVTYQSTSAGSSGHYTQICDNCGAPVGKITSHTYGGWSSNGWNSGHSRTCTDCGYTQTASHSFGPWEKHNETYCRQYCTVCNGYASSQHTGGTATCTSGPICSRCGSEYGSALGHSYSSATCTSPATCTICGTTSGSALGHDWSSATCTTPKTCKRCGETSGSALGHSYSSTVISPATCTSSGTRKYTCSRCGDSYTESIPATGHSYTNSCSICGTANVVCSKCGDIKSHICSNQITYNANGGTGAPASQTKTANTSIKLSTTIPTKAGYEFMGWATSSTATTATYQPGDTYSENSDLNLYAVWALIQFDVTLNPTSYTYDGSAKTPAVTVKKDGNTMTLNTDYTLTFSNNKNAGTASVIVTGINNYEGQSTAKTFTISKRDLTVTPIPTSKEYGQADPSFTYSYSGNVSGEVPSYTGTVSRAIGESLGSYAFVKNTFALKNNGTFLANNYNVVLTSTKFTITARDINNTQASYKRFWKYTGSAITPDVVLSDGSKQLTLGTDYEMAYADNTAIGNAKITFTGKGNYTGTKIVYFVISEGGAQSDQIVLDEIPPVISNITATNEQNSVTINATIIDPDIEEGVPGSGVRVNATKYAITASSITPVETSPVWYSTNVVPTTAVGTLSLWIMAKDNVGNVTIARETIVRSADDQYIEFIVDLDAPIISDMAATVNNQTVTISATITDPLLSNGDPGSGVNTSATRYAVTQTNTQPAASSSDWQTSNEITTSLTGTVYAWIKAVDNVGNTSYKSVSVDLTRPMSEITVSGIKSEYTYTGSDITPEPIVQDGDTVLVKGTDYTVEYKDNLNVGTATITIKGAGKYVGTKEITFAIVKASLTNPTLTGSSTVYDGTSHTITVSEVMGGTVNYRTSTDDTTWSSWTTTKPSLTNVGKLYVQAKVVGDSNHNDTSATTSVILEVTARPITVTAGSSNRAYNGSALTNTTASVTSGSLVAGHTISVTTSGSITNVGSVTNTLSTVKVMNGSTDVTSNYNITKANGTLTITKATASITVNPTSVAVAQGSSTTVTITYNGDGTLSAVSAATGTATATLSGKTITVKGVAGGTTTITVSVTGATNYNTPTAVTISVTVYGTPSAPTITPSRTTWGNTDVTFTMAGATPPLGGQTLQYKIGNGEWTEYPDTAVTVSTEGETTVYGRAINTTSTGLVSDTVSFVAKIDKTAPSTTAPTVSSTSNTITAICNQADNLATVNSGINASLTRYRLLASDGTTVVKDWQASNTFTGLTVSTTYQVQTRVTDNAGNTTESTKVTKATAEAPTGVTEIVTTPTAWTNGDVTVTITYPTISGYTNKIYKVGSGNEQTYTASFTVSENTTVTAYLKDGTGNVAASKTVTISNIDKVKPTVTVSGIIGRTVKLTLADSVSGVNGYAITTTNTVPAASSFTAVTTGATATVSTKVATTGTYYAWAKDVAGNISTATTITVAEPILMAEPRKSDSTTSSYYIFGNTEISQRKKDIAIISIEDTLPATLPSGAWDVSRDKNGSVYAWLTVNASDSTKYDLHIAADGNIIASSGGYLFAHHTNCTEIQGLNKLDTSKVINMYDMFYGCSSLTSLNVSNFDTSKVTNMSYMFEFCSSLTNLDVSEFDTSKVTTMQDMFYNCNNLTSLDVSNFDTSKVTYMQGMFSHCSSLTNIDVSGFDTSKVTNMSYMFWYCNKLTSLDVRNFDTSNVTTMSYMFAECHLLTSLNLSGFNTSNVTNMSQMFQFCRKLENLNISNFSANNLTRMDYMFNDCNVLTSLDFGKNFDTSKVTSMAYMFNNCSSLKSIPTGLDLSNTAITSNDSTSNGYAKMFNGCSSLTSATINSKYIGYEMFYGCNKLTDITITSDVQGVYNSGTGTPSGAFKYTGSGKLVTNLNSSSTAITKDNYDWATDNRIFDADGPEITFTYYNNTIYAKSQSVKVTVTDMSAINTSSLKYIWSQSTTAPTESAFTSNGTAFTNETTITKSTDSGNDWYLWVIAKDEYGNTTITKSNAVYLDNIAPTITINSIIGRTIKLTLADSASGVNGYAITTTNTAPAASNFTAVTAGATATVSTKVAATGTYYAWAKDVAGNISTATTVTVAEPILMAETSANANTNKYILGNSTITQRRADIAIISIENTLPATLPSGAWDVSRDKNGSVYAWLTENATDSTKYDLHIAADGNIIASSGNYLFSSYTNCTEIQDLNKLDTSKVTSMVSMFDGCSSLTSLDVSNFDTSSVTDMMRMFSACSNLTSLNLSNFDTSNVTSMREMFSNCGGLTSLNVENFNTSKVTTTHRMFAYTSKLTTLNLNSFDTSKVTNMSWMFCGCSRLTSLDLSNFDTSKVTSMYYMFGSCYSLKSIPTGLDLSNTAITSNDSTKNGYAEMFSGCSSLTSATINSKYIGYQMFYGCNKLTDITITSDVQGVYNSGTGTPSGAFKYTGNGKLLTVLNSSSTAITKDNYDWATDNRIFDADGPEIAFTYYNNTTYAKSQSVKVTVTDMSAIDTSSLKYIWSQSTTAPTESAFTSNGIAFTNEATITKSTDSGNNWYLWVIAKDEYGNTTITKSDAVYLDNSIPTVTCPSSIVYGSSITLTLKDNGSGVDGWQVTKTTTTPTSGWTTITASTNTSTTFTPTAVGTYYAWAKDVAGNVSAYAKYTVTEKNISTSSDITASLEYTTTVYDGNAKKPQTIVMDGTYQLKSGTDYDVAYTNNTNVGTATVTITAKGNYTGTITLTFTITNASMEVTATGYTGVYDGSAHGITVTAPTGSTIKYGTTSGTYDLTASPAYTNVGTYTVYYKVSRANYTDVTGSAKVIITAKSMTGSDFTITLNQTVYTYDGTAHTPTATVKENGTTLASGNYTVTYKDNIDVGTATATITGKGNYTGSVTRSFTINKKTLTITPTAGQSKTFGDVEPNLLYEVSGAVGSQTATFTGYLSRVAGENVGKYAITQGTLALVDYNDFKASNYVISFVEGVEFEIKQKTLTSSDIKASLEYTQTTYDGTEKKPSVTVTEDGATLANTNYSVAYSANINAGTAKVTITGKGNYSGSITLNFTINKRTLTVTPTAGQNKTYGEADPTLTYTYTNNVSGQTPKFTGALERATGENVGTYAINQGSIALANNGTFLASNYTLVFTTGVKFEIKAKAMTSNDITITIKTPTYTYDGTAHTPSVEVKDGTTVVAAVNYTVTYTNNTNAGTATVKVTGKSNYSGEKTATFIINKRDLTVTPTANQSKIYGTSDPTLTYTYTNNVSGETPKFTGSLTRAAGENVGTYAISKGTLALADNSKFLANNYNLVFTSGVNFAIVEKGIGALEITLSNNTYEYDGTAHTPTVTVKDGSTTLTNGTHYTITYKDNIDAGTATVTITGNGDYEGTTSKTFTITAKKLTVTPNAGQSKIYGAVDPTFTYTSNGTISGQTVKFTGALSRESGNAVGTYNILQGTLALTDNGTFKASNYTLVFTTGVKFEIKAKAMTSNDITITVNIPTGGYIYDGTAKTPSVTVRDGTTTLGTSDYTVTYTNNVNAGTATVKVTGKSNYTGEKTATFTIGKRDLNVAPASGQNKTYGVIDPTLTYTYTNNVTGETPKFTGKLSRESGESVGTYNILQGTLTLADNSPFLANNYNLIFANGVKFEIKAKSMTSSDVKINISIPTEGYTYDGTAKEPTVTVYDGSTLVSAANYTVTYSNNINAGDDAVVKVTGKGNYSGEKTDYFTINKRNLNVTPTANQSKVYGTNDKTLTYTYSNNVIGETPKFIGSLARATGENVGEYEITIGTLALEDNDKFLASNYNIVLVTGVKFKITAKALSLNDITITLAGTSFVYDATAKRMGVTVTDGVGTLRLNTDYTLTYSNNINAGNSATVIIKGAGNYTGEVARTYTINKRDLTVTPKAGQNKTYGETDPTFTYTYTNNVSGQTPAFTGSLARATGEAVGTYAITQGTLALKDNNTFLVSNYNLVFTDNVMFEIKSKSMTSSDITITINIPTGGYTYDGTAKEPGVAVTDNGKEVSSANYTVTYTNNVNAGSNATVKVTGKGNYSGEKTATFTIAKRTLRVTPTAGQSKIYGSTDPTLTYEYSNNVSGEIPKFTGSLTRAAGENVGTYAINQGTIALADNGSFLVSNYTLSFTTGVTFEIKEKGIGALTITVAKGPFTYDGTAKTPSVTVADGSTTLKEGTDYTVTYSNNMNAGTAKVTITGKGDYTGSVTKEFTIEKRNLTVTPSANQSKVYGEADPGALTYGYTGNVSGETPKFSGSIVRQAGENVGTYAITQGTLALINNGTFLTNNYNLVFASNVTFEIKAKGMTSSDITITVNIPTEGYTYDGTAKTPTVVVKDGTKTLSESDYNVSYSNNVNAGNNATVKVTGVGNYSGEKTATFAIGKRNLNVTPKQNQEKTYGAADPTSFTYDYSNNVSGETPKFTGSLTRDAGETVGKYNINQGTLALANNTPFLASNYNLVFTTGVKFTITEKSASGFTVTGINPSYEFTNSQIAPVPTVKDGTETLVPGQDYKVTYGENVAVGKGTVIIEGIGNYTGTKEVTFNIVDTTPPTVPSIIAKLENVSGNNYDGSWTNKNVWVNLTSTDLVGVVAYEWSTSSTSGFSTTGVSVANGVGTITFDVDRNATIYFRAKDANGNYSGTSSMTLKVDKTAPTNVKVNTSVTTSTITAQVTSVDGSISGVKEYEFYLDGVLKSTQTGISYTFTGLKDGTEYTVTVKVRDNAGNVTSEIGTTPAKTTTDGISNNITLTPDTTAWVNRNVIVTIEWPNTILTKQIKVGNGAWTNYDGTTYAIEENTTIYARLTDGENVGNGVSLEISNIDKVKPEVKVSAASIVYGNSVTLTFTDDLSGVNGWAITRNTTAPTTWTQVTPASLGATATYKPTAVGTYYAWTKDQAGNVSVYAQFVVTEKDISTSSDIQITLADTTFTYDGTAKEIGVTVKENGAPLVANTDYEVTYSNNINAGTATVVVKGVGNYKGEVTKQFTINRRALNVIPNNQSKVFGEADPELTYTYSNNVTGETPKFDKSLTRDSGENVGSYNITQGTLTLVDNGSFLANNYTIVFTTGKTLTITRKTIGNMTARLGQTTYTYDGTEKKPSVTVTDGQVTLIASNYTVAYSNNVNAGTATVTITGVGNYSGTITLEFTINARELVVKPDAGLSKIYGETDPVLTYTHSGAVTGETPKFSGSLARATGEDVGVYPIGIGTLALVDNGAFMKSNYKLVFSSEVVNFTIIPAVREVTIDPNGGSYNGVTRPQTVQGEVGTTITLDNPVRDGYKFTGWTLTGGGKLVGDKYTFEMTSGTVTANWEDNSAPTKPILTSKVGGPSGDEYVPDTWINRNVYIEAKATDNVGVKAYQYQVNGTTGTWTEMPMANGIGSMTITEEGIVTIYVRAVDAVGNVSEVESIIVKIDKTAPTGTVVINDDAMYVNDTNVILTLTAQDNLSEVTEMSISNTPEAATFEPFSETKRWTLTSGDGQKTVYVVLKDAAGNMTSTIWE